jgi:hypothetical protein
MNPKRRDPNILQHFLGKRKEMHLKVKNAIKKEKRI